MQIPSWLYADGLAREQTGTEAMLQNADLKVVEPARRLWSKRNFVAFWLADSINLNTWMIIGSSVAAGMSWYEAWIATWIGYSIVAIFICISGRIGATYHISFPVASRASWGIWFSLWPIFNRGAMACVWYGVQAWLGGQCFVLMFRSMAPSYNNIGTKNLDGGRLGTRDFIGFMVFWLVSLIFIYPPVHKIRHLFTVKAVVVPIAGLLFMVWAIVKAGGIGPVVKQKGKLQGSARGWMWVTSIMACVSNFATLILNNSDFTRFARSPSSTFYPQLITIPCGFAITCFVGVIVGSASESIYGEKLWNPLELLGRMLDNGPSSATRAGVWFIAFAFALAQLGVNIAANSVSAGSDLTAVLPRFLNIRRSGYICAIVGLVIKPWILVSDSSTFTTYLSAYSTFLSSIIGVVFADYYLVRKGFLKVDDLYSGDHHGAYYFWNGCNWRAAVAYVAGVAINIGGFVDAVGVKGIPDAVVKMYTLNFFLGLAVSMSIYVGLCRWSPVPACGDKWPSEAVEYLDTLDQDEMENIEKVSSTDKVPSTIKVPLQGYLV